MRPSRVGLALLVLATASVYWPVVDYEFAPFDDRLYIVDNEALRAGLSPEGLAFSIRSFRLSNWHPLTWISYLFDYELYGLAPGGYHLSNLVLHLGATTLLFLALERMTAAPWSCLLVAALFALHPTRVETVAWIGERKGVLSGLFAMATLYAYARHAERPGPGRLLVVGLTLGLGLLSKPVLVGLPFLLLLLDYWPLARTGGLRGGPKLEIPRLRGLVIEKLPLFVLSALSAIMTLLAQRPAMLEEIPLRFRIGNALVAYAGYVQRTLWPEGLAPFYAHPRETLALPLAGAAGAMVIALTALALRARRRFPYFVVGWLWFLGMMVPMLGLVQVGRQSLADRYTYLPLVGLFIAAAFGARDLAREWRARGALVALAVIACVVLAVASRAQLRHWATPEAVLARVLAVNPGNRWFHFDLGTLHASRGDLDASIQHLSEAIRLDPDYANAHWNLALVLASSGDLDRAEHHHREVLRLLPEDPHAHFNLAVLLAGQGRRAEAIPLLRAALLLRYDFVEARLNLALALRLEGREAEARAELEEVLRLSPHEPRARKLLDDAP